MSKENKTSDKQQNGNDFIADVSKRYCIDCGDDITDTNYALVCAYCRLQLYVC